MASFSGTKRSREEEDDESQTGREGLHEDGRTDNHACALRMNDWLVSKGWRTWFDSQGDMRDNMQRAMAEGMAEGGSGGVRRA